MIQLLIAFCLAVFWSGVYALAHWLIVLSCNSNPLACYFVPLFPLQLIGVVFVMVGGFSFMALALTCSSKRIVNGKH